MKLTLGSANFGNEYGHAQNKHQLDLEDVNKILRTAMESGFVGIDTAISYGKSQQFIGKSKFINKFEVTTKIPATMTSALSLREQLEKSFKELRIDSFANVLFHSIETIKSLRFPEMFSYLRELQINGKIGKIGVSVYEEDEVRESLELHPNFETFQINESIIDQSKIESKYLLSLAKSGIEFSVRSIFLQGLLLDSNVKPSNILKDDKEVLDRFHLSVESSGIRPLDACIYYAKQIPWASNLIFGVNSESNIIDIKNSFDSEINFDYKSVLTGEPTLYDPRKWKQNG